MFKVSLDNLINNVIAPFLVKNIEGLVTFLKNIMLVTPTTFLNTAAFWKIYKTMTLLGITSIAFVIITAAWHKTSGKSIDMKTVITRAAGYPIYVILAPHVLMKCIELFNRVAYMLLTTEHFILSGNTSLSGVVGLVLLQILYLYLIVKLVIFYAKRLVKILLFATLAPLLFAAWCLPERSTVLTTWLEDIFSLLMSQVIHSLILLILGTVIISTTEINGLLSFTFQIGALLSMNEVEAILAKYVNSKELLFNRRSSNIRNIKHIALTSKGLYNKIRRFLIGK